MSRQFVFNPFTAKFDIIDVSSSTANVGTAVVDFGSPPADTIASVTVTGQGSILATSRILVEKRIEATTDHTQDETMIENWEPEVGNIVPGTGFTIYGKCTAGRTYGKFNVSWSWI